MTLESLFCTRLSLSPCVSLWLLHSPQTLARSEFWVIKTLLRPYLLRRYLGPESKMDLNAALTLNWSLLVIPRSMSLSSRPRPLSSRATSDRRKDWARMGLSQSCTGIYT
ncbi:hypothetical protein RSAG8_06406, partial [Rhizoctonia solani AG-8 WAC10335]